MEFDRSPSPNGSQSQKIKSQRDKEASDAALMSLSAKISSANLILWTTSAGLSLSLCAGGCAPDFGSPSGYSSKAPEGEHLWPALEASEQSLRSDSGENPWLVGFGADPASAVIDPSTGLVAEMSPKTSSPGSETDGESSDPFGVGPEPTPAALLVAYKEGRGSDKRLTVENTGQVEVSCLIEVYSNGGTSPWRSLVVPPLNPGARLSLCTDSEAALDTGRCEGQMTGAPFNGNDALVLVCSGVVTDSFGQVGTDPGKSWGTAEGVSSTDQALIRCQGAAPSDPALPFDPATDWRRTEEIFDWSTSFAACPPPGGDGMAGASF